MNTDTPRTSALDWSCANKDTLQTKQAMEANLKSHIRLELELAAAIKERNELREECERQMAYGVKQHEFAQDAIKERNESHAREVAYREALKNLLPFVAAKMKGEEALIIYQLDKSGISDPRFLAAEAALSQSPPPVVLKADADQLADAIQTDILDSPRLNELAKEQPRAATILKHFRAVLSTYRTKHPKP